MSDAQRLVNDAIQEAYLQEGEIVTGWIVVAEVADINGKRLIHRAGGGLGGEEPPMIWTALGMLRGAVIAAEAEVNGAPPSREDQDDP